MYIVYIIIGLAVLLGLVGCFAFFKAVVRTKGVPPQGVDRPAFVRDNPEAHRLIEQGREWFGRRQWEQVDIISYDGLKLTGFLLEHENARGTFLLMHGYRSDGYTDFSCAYDFYYSLGFNLLVIHERAHGLSEGRYICFGVKERFDCLSWCRWLGKRFGPDSDIFVSGVSMGGTIVQMASALELPDCVRGIVSDCGFTSPWEEVRHVMRDMAHIPAFPLLWIVDAYCRVFAGFDLREYSTVEAVRQTKKPILFVHGQADIFVPSHMTEEGYAACASEKELILVPGAEHGMSFLVDTPRCQRELTEFVAKHGSK